MALTIAQTVSQIDEKWWKWAVWVEGSNDELATVESVTYLLHPTFAQPVQVRKDPADKFRLEEEGWGEFAIQARVHPFKGEDIELHHWLQLGGSAKESSGKPVVFISGSAADGPVISELRKAIENDFEVREASDLPTGDAWSASLSDALGSSDAVVAIFSDLTSSWVKREVATAAAMNVPVIPVTINPAVDLPGDLRHLNTLTLNVVEDPNGRPNASKVRAAGKQIANALHQQLATRLTAKA